MRSLKFCFSLLILLNTEALFAAKAARIATFPIPLLVESDRRGVFIELTREISRRSDVKIEIDVTPTAKTILDFSTSKVDAFFPATELNTPKSAIRTAPFYTKTDYVFSRNNKILTHLSELKGKKVGLTFRYPYAKKVTENKQLKFEFAADDVSNMKKLAAGEIDAFIVEERSGLAALRESGAKNIVYNQSKPISRLSVFYAFQNSDEGRAWAESFTKVIESMKRDGTFQKMMDSGLN